IETIQHLFFECSLARVVWSIVAIPLKANNIPTSLRQYWNWCSEWTHTSPPMHAFVLAAICWAIWKARSKACFEFKWLKHPAEIICHACSFLKFWTGLHKEEFQ
ncbi:hypothetical protein PVAP13_5KG469507, partial [Panicum virgatum]